MDHVIEVEHLRKSYRSTVAVQDISFTVSQGEIFGILGPNGAGKTTTVECIEGLRKPDSGHIRVLGFNPVTQSHQLRRHIGCQLQESALPERLKVWEALDLFASFVPGESNWRLLLEQWGLAGKENATFASLSGGQRQRLFIALALVNDPEVVFLDELTQGLDPAARRVAWGLIRAVRENGATVVLVTHYMDEAEHLCDRIAVINGGRIVAQDTPQGLINQFGGQTRLTFSRGDTDIGWLEQVPHVARVDQHGTQVEVSGNGPVLPLVAAELVQHGLVPHDLRVVQPTLEDVFLKLTTADGSTEGPRL